MCLSPYLPTCLPDPPPSAQYRPHYHPPPSLRSTPYASPPPQINTVRVLINTPASQGAIGDLYNFKLDPSLTLGCGSWGSTSVSTNVGPWNLLNVKTVTERRENMLWFRVPPKIYFKGGE